MNKISNFTNLTFVDLTHTLSPTIPHWEKGCSFQQKINSDYDEGSNDTRFRTHTIEMRAGVGTHIDAPAHCVPGGTDIAALPLEHLFAPCVVIDVSEKAHESYRVTLEDILNFENYYGKINKNSFVIIRTGWDKFWSDSDKYRNNLLFPTISEQAAECLLKRDIVGLGVDTLSPDSETDGFPVHRLILGAGKYIIENIANSDKIPAIGAHSIALPIKIEDGTESPIRLIAAITTKN